MGRVPTIPIVLLLLLTLVSVSVVPSGILVNEAKAQACPLICQIPGQILSGHQAQLGKELAGQATKTALGDVCLSCWNGLAGQETQQVGKVLSGELGHLGVNLGTGGGSGGNSQGGSGGSGNTQTSGNGGNGGAGG